MKDSKEVLERLFGSYVSSKCYGIDYKKDDEDYNIIKQSLDQLEKFAHENASLHTKIESLHTEIESLKKSKSNIIKYAQKAITKLSIENEELYDNLKALEEKATPKRPITIKTEGKFDYPTNRIKCPTCGVQLPMKKNCLKKKIPITYCDRCGQKLDWSDVDE